MIENRICVSCANIASPHSTTELCARCDIEFSIDQDDMASAYAIADLNGLEESVVTRYAVQRFVRPAIELLRMRT